MDRREKRLRPPDEQTSAVPVAGPSSEAPLEGKGATRLPGSYEGPMHFAWVLIDCGGRGWSWARLRIPQSVVDDYAVGVVHPPNSRPLIASKIGADVASDRILDKRGWHTPDEIAAIVLERETPAKGRAQ